MPPLGKLSSSLNDLGVEDRVVSPSTSFRINKVEPQDCLTRKIVNHPSARGFTSCRTSSPAKGGMSKEVHSPIRVPVWAVRGRTSPSGWFPANCL